MTGAPSRTPSALAALFAAVALAAASCRRFQPMPLSPADSASALESRSLNDPELPALFERVLLDGAPRWPIEKWELGSLTLAALYYHPSLESETVPLRPRTQVAARDIPAAEVKEKLD
jgi:hypothetical protein